jgi:hypothetical protein
MRIRGPLVCLTALVLGLLVTVSAQAQALKRGVHRMEINNGTMQTVRYFPVRLSPGEGAALRDLERSENELTFVRSIQDLKRQYIADENVRENQRALAQQLAYGNFVASTSIGGYGTLGNVSTGGFGNPLLFTGYGGYRDVYGLGGYYGLGSIGYGYGYGYGPGITGGVGGARMASALDLNLTDERSVKDALVSVLPQQATPQYAASIDRNYDRAVARASSSPSLRLALGLPDGRRGSDFVLPTPASAEVPSSAVMITLKDGTTISGDKMTEDKDWITIHTKAGRKIRVRPAEVTKIDEGKAGGILPAG